MEGKQLTVGSLFSGIGGLDLGLERAGMRVIWQSEIDPYACKVLAKHWPDVPNLGNIKDIDWSQVERPDVICGGYPCQPFSMAGKRKGEEDERHLWPWVREAIRILRPRYAILENVRGHLSLGGTTVVGEIASLGYDAEWRVVSAASVGANHRRDRLVLVAYPKDNRPQDECQPIGSKQAFTKFGSDGTDVSDDVAYPDDARSRTPRCGTNGIGQTKKDKGWGQELESGSGRCSPTLAESNCVVMGINGSSKDAGCQDRIWRHNNARETGYVGWEWWQVEPEVGRVAHGVPSRVDRLRGLGNAVVPQVAEVIGRLVVNAHETRCEGF